MDLSPRFLLFFRQLKFYSSRCGFLVGYVFLWVVFVCFVCWFGGSLCDCRRWVFLLSVLCGNVVGVVVCGGALFGWLGASLSHYGVVRWVGCSFCGLV